MDAANAVKFEIPGELGAKRVWAADVPIDERIKYLEEEMFLGHPKLRRALIAINQRRANRRRGSKALGVLVLAVSGGGKSRLIRYMHEQMPSHEEEDRTVIPFLSFSVPVVCDLANFCTAILRAMRDPYPDAGDEMDQMDRITTLVVECRLEVIAIDNVQDIPQRRGVKGVETIGNFIRDLTDLDIVVVMLGTEEARVVVDSNRQLKRRAPGVVHLGGYDVDAPEELGQVLRVIDEIDKRLPLAAPSGLASRRAGLALAYAGDGVFGHLINILSVALGKTEEGGVLLDSHLEEAFLEIFLDAGRKANPFSKAFGKLRRLNQPGEAHHVAANPKAYK